MKLALLQPLPSAGDENAALDRLETALSEVATKGASLLLAPELMLPGYNQPALHARLAQPVGGAWDQALSAMARRHGVALVVGRAEREADTLFNTALAFGPDGALLARHRKRLLYGPMEKSVFAPGAAGVATFDLNGQRFGLLICYEIEFPECARALSRAGAGVILVPTANPAGFEHVQRLLIPARAYESRAVVAYANFCGNEAGLAFGGHSVIAGPDGAVLASAGTEPALLICDLPTLGSYPAELLSTQIADLDALDRA